ncbi:PIH1 domain-containing protein 1-like isoform X2 [Mercenaria mercenaria]|nr:PIH1 domain-containing protein 1-like isoform X2 [Mercenaria mercenaria]XP_053396858.1 PIH1 domain-containing protein 1-like isoform X2 [Mercenaria mercenaria]XP_053396859.1 PIH1 domain-containing protein 1-like isoform X2 [Mercenaria mercenaria]XP_053396860.1 PIH1 domain-containing protein 1-like isoform X2 [Mercenaria mercenaria]
MDPSLLDSNLEDKDALFNQLLMNAAAEDPSILSALNKQAIPTTQVRPVPGFCLKTKTDKNEKVFVNICMADNVPAPKDISDEELIKLLESDDPTGYRVPMSIGEPHAEIDKSGQGCTAYDVVVSPAFMEKMKTSELFKTFFLTVMMEGLENKYEMLLSREWVILKNRRFVGTLQEQSVRTQSKPVIMEMDQSTSPSAGSQSQSQKSLIQEVSSSQEEMKSRGKEPDYRIVQEPAEGHPDFLVAEINLPQVKVSSSINLDLGEDRILVQTRSNIYYLDIYLPFYIVQTECGAQFNRKTRILTITMPVLPES